jgi:hypothetical protein
VPIGRALLRLRFNATGKPDWSAKAEEPPTGALPTNSGCSRRRCAGGRSVCLRLHARYRKIALCLSAGTITIRAVANACTSGTCRPQPSHARNTRIRREDLREATRRVIGLACAGKCAVFAVQPSVLAVRLRVLARAYIDTNRCSCPLTGLPACPCIGGA